MAERSKRYTRRLILWVVLFGLGFGAGFYVRDRQQHEKVEEAVARRLEQIERAGGEALERGRRAGEALRGGAKAAAESAKAAVEETTRDTSGG